MPAAVLDENVSLLVAETLKAHGYEAIAVARLPGHGMKDESVFALAREKKALLVTRDAHFKNPLRFPPGDVVGILFIANGNLSAEDEAELVAGFLKNHALSIYEGRLVLLSTARATIR